MILKFRKNRVGKDTRILRWTMIYHSEIGDNCLIGNHCTIAYAQIGNNCIIGNMSLLCRGVTIEDNVFIGDCVCFTNDKHPSIEKYWGSKKEITEATHNALPTVVKKGATIGSGSTILPVTIGENAFIGAGSVVTKDVPAGEVWAGNPARRIK